MSLDPISAVPTDDPYPLYRELRDHHPVYYSPERDLWYLSRYADVHDAVNDAGVFSSAQGVVPSGFVSDTPVLITMDPPAHTELRKAVQRAFTPKQIAEMEQHIRDVAAQLLEALPASGEVDAVTAFTDQLPLLVMTELLGVDLADREMFKRCGDIIVAQKDVAAMGAAQVELTEYLAGVFAKRRAEPRDDFITKLVSPTESGDTLSDGDLLGLCFLLLVAGTETTTGGLGTGMMLLDRFRDARDELLEHPELMTTAVDEILRYDAPTQGLSRVLLSDITLHDTTIPVGARVHLLFAAANRDERQFPDPDRFDVSRTPNQHLAFGFGNHYCLGASLAKMEIKVGMEELLRRAPDYAISTGGIVAHAVGDQSQLLIAPVRPVGPGQRDGWLNSHTRVVHQGEMHMATRRVVTGHTPEGHATVASDGPVDEMSLGPGVTYETVWARDDVAHFPDDGSMPAVSGAFPPPGGCAFGISVMPPGADRESHDYLRDNLPDVADPDEAGMHRTATLDFEYIIEGTLTLELDDGVEVELGPGDVVVQNGTRHRWSNRGDTPVKFIAITVGATHDIKGGRPV